METRFSYYTKGAYYCRAKVEGEGGGRRWRAKVKGEGVSLKAKGEGGAPRFIKTAGFGEPVSSAIS